MTCQYIRGQQVVLLATQAHPLRELFLNYPYPPFPLHVGFVSKQASVCRSIRHCWPGTGLSCRQRALTSPFDRHKGVSLLYQLPLKQTRPKRRGSNPCTVTPICMSDVCQLPGLK